jgi:hypothetical protein
MKTIPKDIYRQLQLVSSEVKRELFYKGLVVPVQNEDGTISIGHYTIVKDSNASYAILDHAGEAIIDGINLPQSAILLANRLALGKYKDAELLIKDREYGYADFEEQLYKRAINRKNTDNFSIYLTKYDIAKVKKQSCKNAIIKSFEKLIKLV